MPQPHSIERQRAAVPGFLVAHEPGLPDPVPPPMTPPAPIGEPEPDRLPDETPLPNPDENDQPAKTVIARR